MLEGAIFLNNVSEQAQFCNLSEQSKMELCNKPLNVFLKNIKLINTWQQLAWKNEDHLVILPVMGLEQSMVTLLLVNCVSSLKY